MRGSPFSSKTTPESDCPCAEAARENNSNATNGSISCFNIGFVLVFANIGIFFNIHPPLPHKKFDFRVIFLFSGLQSLFEETEKLGINFLRDFPEIIGVCLEFESVHIHYEKIVII